MFRLNWTVSSAVRAHVKRILGTAKTTAAVPVSHCSSLPPEEREGFGADLTIGEQKLISKLKTEFPDATHLQVSDVSGGCGAMYQISIETPEFIGKRKIQQHQMVNKILEEEIKEMHGLQLNTKEPDTQKE